LAQAVGNSAINLSWTAPSGPVTYYDLYRSTTPGAEGATPYRVGISGTSFQDTGVAVDTTYYYTVAAENIAGTGPASTEASASTSATERFVQELYLDLLGRSADPGGLAFWTQQIDVDISGGLPIARTRVAQGLMASAEYRTDVVDTLYEQVLDRAPDAGGLANGLAFLGAGNSTQELEASFLGSDEYFTKQAGGTNAGFLSALYGDVLGRAIDPSGLQGWINALAGGTTRSQVAAAVVGSLESATDRVKALYQEFLRRPADTSGLATFAGQLVQGLPELDVIIDLVGSAE
jgi:hypothetical protein